MRLALFAAIVGCSSRPAAITTAKPVDPSPPAFRLPGDVKPVRYALELTVVPDRERAPGRVHIDATVVQPTRIVWLNASGLTIAHAELAGQPARVIPGGVDFIGLAASAELPPGPLAIDIAFEAPIDHARSRGLYAEREGNETYAYTFFEAIDARRAFPCFDEPAYKVPWKLVFHVKPDQVALGNAPVVQESSEGELKRVELAESKPLPSYLVAFVVGPFELVDGGTAGRAHTPLRFIVPKGRAGELGWAKQSTPRVVSALEDYFRMNYPFEKLDVAVVPRFWGTMEHPGIVAMGQPLTLIRPTEQTREREQQYTNILAHELSHYWFGDLVTMAWWDDTWLNEALGEWSDMNVTDAVEPAWRYRDDRVAFANRAMAADETLSIRSIRQPVTTREGIEASFDGDITYLKGSSVVRMFEAMVGREPWRDFIDHYLAAHAWGNASADDFIAALQAALGAPIANGFRSFIDQPGVPLVRIEASCSKLVVHQQRALPVGVTDPVQRSWRLPVCVRYGDAREAHHGCVELTAPTGELAVEGGCPTWILPNADANGYYRSSIDPKVARGLLDPLAATAKLARPTPAEKLMTIGDLRAMVARDELAIDQLLAIAPLIVADRDDKVARRSVELASFRSDALDEPLYQASRAWLLRVFGPTARALGWQRAATDSDDREDLRRTLVPMIARLDPKLGAEADELADRWIADRTGLPDDLVDGALAVAAYHGDAARFERLLAAAKAARDRTELARIIAALGAVRDPTLASRALELMHGHELDLRDTIQISSLLYQRENRDRALAFFGEHLDELLARMRDDEASWLLGHIAGAFCDPVHRKIATDLVGPRAAKIDGAQASVAKGLEQTDQCITELARELPALRAFLMP